MRVATSLHKPQNSYQIFATAHSCGLRRIICGSAPISAILPQRIRAGCDGYEPWIGTIVELLPQRIRAGCDGYRPQNPDGSQFCHSAFVRVATRKLVFDFCSVGFATAHSCGLRLNERRIKMTKSDFATAHSCGLRRCCPVHNLELFALPQRIRAGCDLHGGLQRLHLSHFATAHSCGLRLSAALMQSDISHFATAHSCGLRLRKSNAAHCEFAARR